MSVVVITCLFESLSKLIAEISKLINIMFHQNVFKNLKYYETQTISGVIS